MSELSLSLFSTPEMDEVFSLARQVQYMARFEWALASALEAHRIAPKGTAAAVEPFADGTHIDLDSLVVEARGAGNLAIPFVRQFTNAAREANAEAARFVHYGTTSQDVLDTALVLQMRDALSILERDLDRLEQALILLTRAHQSTILAGRTWLQQGPPVTVGLKTAGWLAAIRRHRRRVQSAGSRAIVLQFGGAVGTLSALRDKGIAVAHTLAQRLDLMEPELPWHTHRDNLAEVAAALGLLVGTLGKMAQDVALLMQSEVAEAREPAGEGRGGSSTMPHKRNPVASAFILAAARRVPALVATMLSAMVQEHERALSGWQAEWETLPEIFKLAASALSRACELAEGIEFDADRMQANLDATRGLILSEAVSTHLAASLGRTEAHELLERASRRAVESKGSLREVLLEMEELQGVLNGPELDRLLDLKNYLGSTQAFIRRVLGED
jgi:3-carboxy-cis,cis-muconate cycloisomerase